MSLGRVSLAPDLCTYGRMISLAVALALQTPPQPAPRPQNVTESAIICVMMSAARLEPTGETANVIADAAIIACDREIDALENETAVDYQRRRGGDAATANEVGVEARASFERLMRQNTVERILAIRSSR